MSHNINIYEDSGYAEAYGTLEWPGTYFLILRDLYEEAGLEAEAVYRPLANGDEGWKWGAETHLAPWVVWVLRRAAV